MDDHELVLAFESGRIANADFHHALHLRLALAYLCECRSVEEAIDRMASSLRRFAAAAGKAERYHHTLTVFWMRSVARLLEVNLPLRYYSSDRLFTEQARAEWIEPNLRAIDDKEADETQACSGRSPGDPSRRIVSR
jgi:hypothetical protein